MRLGHGTLAMLMAGISLPAGAQAQATAQGGVEADANPAGDTARPGSAEPESSGDVIVTARRRAERLQDAPLSVTALTAEDMAARGINSLSEVARRVPSLNYGDFGDVKLSPTSLRGVVSGAGSAGADPAIGYYVDDVYVGQGAGASIDLYDIERVEVLRGPQGTLFGRNSIGGVISLTTRRPSDAFEASGQALFGNYDRQRLAGSISGPLVPGILSARVTAVRDRRDGYEENIFLDRDVNNARSWSVRGQLLFTIDADTSLLLTASRRELDQETLVFDTLRYNPASLVPPLLAGAGFPLNADPYDREVIANDVSEERLRATQASARFETSFGGIHVTNITAWQRHNYYSRTDTCRCQLSVSYDGDPERVERFSNEFRLDGQVGRLTWLAGIYYFHQTSDNTSFIELGSAVADLFGDPSINGLMIGSDARLTTGSTAAFGSLGYAITDRVDVTIGARYTTESKAINYVQTDPLNFLGGAVALRADDDWGRFTPSVNIRYRPSEDLMVYATVSNGFKSGGFNDALGDADGISFGPETLWNYEAGLRASLFGRRLQLSASAFYMDWKDIQITVQNPNTNFFDPIILNAGGAYSRGIEFELNARPTRRLRLGLNGSIQRVRYSDGALPNGTPLRYVPFAPNHTGAVTADYRIPIAGLEIGLSGEYLLRGRTYLTTNNDPDGRVGGYSLLNLRLTLFGEGERWRIALYGDNITNATYRTRLFDLFDNPLNGQKFITLGPPRTYGIEFRASL
jgi:iron complex outermembrane receptor protein